MKKLNLYCLNLLKFTLNTTGEYESKDNKEEPTARRLNGEESAQRRFFNEKASKIEEEVNKSRNALIEEVPEDKRQGNMELLDKIKVVLDEEHEIELSDKTWEVVKKYFEEFDSKIGWVAADDEIVAIIKSKL